MSDNGSEMQATWSADRTILALRERAETAERERDEARAGWGVNATALTLAESRLARLVEKAEAYRNAEIRYGSATAKRVGHAFKTSDLHGGDEFIAAASGVRDSGRALDAELAAARKVGK